MNKQGKIANAVSEAIVDKTIKLDNYYSDANFIADAKEYLKAIKSDAMLCVINHASSSGMTRYLSFKSCKKNGVRYNYRNYYGFFKALGYAYNQSHNGFKISGYGMNMIFKTNYEIIHTLARLGFINKAQRDILAQQTPVLL